MTTTSTPAKIARIAPEIPVHDLQEAISFYVEKLGFELASEMPEMDYAIVERDGIAIHLFRGDARPQSSVGVHMFTNEIEGLHSEFMERGAAIAQPIARKPWGNREFRVCDPSGNELKFTEPSGD